MEKAEDNYFMDKETPEKVENREKTTKQESSSTNFPIIVIGASAGGIEALKKMVAGLPKDFEASLFIVWHMAPNIRGILPDILNRLNTLYAIQPYDKEPVVQNRIYVAPPDHHMLLEEGHIRITKGPKENRFRPAVDPLFRSAAYTYNSKVIGMVLSGALDDGTAGLWTVKHHGGTAIVQNPQDAQVSSMPENAMREVAVDYCVPVAEMPKLLIRLVKELTSKPTEVTMEKDEKTKLEIRIAKEDEALESGFFNMGELSPFTCPECHGVLSVITEGKLKRYRCHTGHAFSPDSLLAAVSENIENNLWNVIRSMEESTMLLNHIGDHFAEINEKKLAAAYFKKAQESEQKTQVIKKAVFKHEQVSEDIIEEQASDDAK